MIDPVSAIAIAGTAFNAVKKGIALGKDVESMYSDIGRWMGAVSDINQSEKDAKNPPFYKKLFNGSSIEEEAMNAFAAKKKAEEMEYELKQYIMFTHGPSAWEELIRMQGKIRKDRQQMIYARQKQKEKIINIVICTIGIGLIVALLGWFAWFVFQTSYLFAGFR
tara:strand:- start:28 stop:522 length:495 start_codon:yes stop_codon:yes gene_type:complete